MTGPAQSDRKTKRTNHFIRFFMCLAALGMPVIVCEAEPEGSHDYPLFGRISGFEISSYEEHHFDKVTFPAGSTNFVVEGHTFQITYEITGNNTPSLYEIDLDLKLMLKNVNAEILWDENPGQDGEKLLARFSHNGKHIYCAMVATHLAGGQEYRMYIVEEQTFQPTIDPPK